MLIAIALLCIDSCGAQTTTVIVPGTADPWLAGMPAGSTASCGDGLCDTVPAPSPKVVTGLALEPGSTLSFSATGVAGYGPDPSTQSGPDGVPGTPCPHLAGAQNGISAFVAPCDTLNGVFLGPDLPSLTPAPPPGSNSAPALKQVFAIGSSAVVTIPAGATRLSLGITDGFGWYNNSGAFQVIITAGQSQLTLTLSQSTSQPSNFYTGVMSSTTAMVNVKDSGGNPLASLFVGFSAVPSDVVSSGHLHTSLNVAPAGGFEGPTLMQSTTTCMTDVSGNCQLTYIAPEISGKFEVTATVSGIDSLSDTKPITVQSSDLAPLGAGILILSGSYGQMRCFGRFVQSAHSLNYYGSTTLRANLINIAQDFFNKTALQIRVNDMSLP